MKRKKNEHNKKIIRTNVSLSGNNFFIDVALAKIVICYNNYNLCVPRARMKNGEEEEDSQPANITK